GGVGRDEECAGPITAGQPAGSGSARFCGGRAGSCGASGAIGTRPPAPRPASPPPAPRTDQRWVNVEVEGQAPDQPLVANRWYTLAFDVDVVQRATAVAAPVFGGEEAFGEGETEITFTVQLDTTDFESTDQERKFRLARTGKALTKARFDIRPLHDGPSTLKA